MDPSTGTTDNNRWRPACTRAGEGGWWRCEMNWSDRGAGHEEIARWLWDGHWLRRGPRSWPLRSVRLASRRPPHCARANCRQQNFRLPLEGATTKEAIAAERAAAFHAAEAKRLQVPPSLLCRGLRARLHAGPRLHSGELSHHCCRWDACRGQQYPAACPRYLDVRCFLGYCAI